MRILFGGYSLTGVHDKLIISIPTVSAINRLVNRELPAPEGGEGGCQDNPNENLLIRRSPGYYIC